MNTVTPIAELSALITERGIITTDVMPFCLVNPNHTSHGLSRFTRSSSNDDIAEAFNISVVELIQERAASPAMEDAVACLMAKLSGPAGTGWLVRFSVPSSRGGYITKLAYAPTLSEVMHRMLQV